MLIPSVCFAVLLWLNPTPQSDQELHTSLDRYRTRMAAAPEQDSNDPRPSEPRQDRDPVAQPTTSEPDFGPRESLMTQPAMPTSQPSPDEILDEIPDPRDTARVFNSRLENLERTSRERHQIESYRRVVTRASELCAMVNRDKKVELTLLECVRRALEHSFTIQVESYNPAIAQTQIVEAEAAFDAVFFLDANLAQDDNPTGVKRTVSESEQRSISGGIRKLLPTGMSTSVSMRQNFLRTDPRAQPFNPLYNNAFTVEFRQPLLRGFGVDYNRRGIVLANIGRDIARSQFAQRVQDVLLNVERAYWQLARLRRDVAVLAESVAQNQITYLGIFDRQRYDATPVQLNNSLSQYQSRYVQFLEAVKLVFDAEDTLKNLLNDPDLLLSRNVEIVPTDSFFMTRFEVDLFAEVRRAIDSRNEIKQAKLGIERSRVQTSAAKNETLPQLDLLFTYEVRGLGSTADNSFDNLTTNRYISYSIGAQFVYPIGNRGPQAALRRARLQENQSMVSLNQITDSVVQEVNNAVRTLGVRWEQVPPQLLAVQAAERNLRALQARTERIDPSYLQTELSGVEQLASTRRVLLQVLADYTTTIVELERAKGTLLEYNQVVIDDDRYTR